MIEKKIQTRLNFNQATYSLKDFQSENGQFLNNELMNDLKSVVRRVQLEEVKCTHDENIS